MNRPASWHHGHISLQPFRWRAAQEGGRDTLLLHPAHLSAELHALLSTRSWRSGAVWSLGLVEGRPPSLQEQVRALVRTRHLSGVRLVLLDLSARTQGELALLFPREVQDFVALSPVPRTPLRATWLHELWPLLNTSSACATRPVPARGAA